MESSPLILPHKIYHPMCVYIFHQLSHSWAKSGIWNTPLWYSFEKDSCCCKCHIGRSVFKGNVQSKCEYYPICLRQEMNIELKSGLSNSQFLKAPKRMLCGNVHPCKIFCQTSCQLWHTLKQLGQDIHYKKKWLTKWFIVETFNIYLFFSIWINQSWACFELMEQI